MDETPVPKRRMPTKEERIARKEAQLVEIAKREEALKKKAGDLKRKLAEMRAPKRRAMKKDNDKRKYILGAMVLHLIQTDVLSREQVDGWLRPWLSRSNDIQLMYPDQMLVLQETAEEATEPPNA